MPGPGIKVDSPEALEEFARNVSRATGNLREVIARLARDLSMLADKWNDPVYRRFADEFGHALKPIGKAADLAEQFVPELKRRAATLREFQR